MAGNRFYFGILVLIFVAIIGWTSYAMASGENEEEIYHVSVIVNDSNSDRWRAFRLGLEQAARDCNVDLNYVSTGKLENVDEEMALINRELENGAEGIIVQMVSSEEDVVQFALDLERSAMVLLESDIIPENRYGLAGPDNIGIGKSVAASVKKDYDNELEGKKIGILSGNQKQLAMQQRLKGLKEEFDQLPIDIVWEVEYTGKTNEDIKIQYEGLEKVDIIIALGNDETERMVDFLQAEEATERECALYGVGCSEKVVYYLDKGVIRTLVVPNEFNIGYQGMKAVVKQLTYHLDKAEDSQVDHLVVNQTNMYDEENQKVLFPIVQ